MNVVYDIDSITSDIKEMGYAVAVHHPFQTLNSQGGEKIALFGAFVVQAISVKDGTILEFTNESLGEALCGVREMAVKLRDE